MVNKNRFKTKIFIMLFLISGAAFSGDANQKDIIKNKAVSDNKNIDIIMILHDFNVMFFYI